MYAVGVTEGNGYRCSCCRYESTETEYFDTLGEAEQFIAETNFRSDFSKRLKSIGKKYNEDVRISNFYIMAEDEPDEDSDNIKRITQELESELKKEEAKADKATKRKKAAAKKAAETKRRELYEKMKEEYEEVK